MPKIEKLLPFAAAFFLLKGLYYAIMDLLFGRLPLLTTFSDLIHLNIQDLIYFELNDFARPFYVILNFIFLILLLIGFTKTFLLKKKSSDKILMLSLAFFSFRVLNYLPKYIIRHFDTKFTSFDYSSTGAFMNEMLTILQFICMLIILIYFTKRRDRIQKKTFAVETRKYELPAYKKHLYKRKNTSGSKRFLNYLFDLLIVWIWAASSFQFYIKTYYKEDYSFSEKDYSFGLFFLMYFFLYTTLTEAISGQTFGKFITNTCVQFEGKSAWRSAFFRSVCRLIPFESLTFITHTNYGWHDTLTGTYVNDINQKDTDSPSNSTDNSLDSP